MLNIPQTLHLPQQSIIPLHITTDTISYQLIQKTGRDEAILKPEVHDPLLFGIGNILTI